MFKMFRMTRRLIRFLRIFMIGLVIGTIGLAITTPVHATCADNDFVQMKTMYTYDEMCSDINELAIAYPDYIKVGSLGMTAMGRDIPYIIMGDENASKSIMVQASIHGREYLCTQVVMKIIEHYAIYRPELNDTNFYIVPMANPDGVSIAQFGADSVSDTATKNFINSIGNTSMWKSNAMGVDLNRNFNIGWNTIDQGVYTPSSDKYKGTAPESENETKGLITLAASKNFSAYISYHMKGNIIYYDEPGNTVNVSKESKILANKTSSITGYKKVNLKSTVSSSGNVVQGGFTDWAQLVLNKPAITIEIGDELPPSGQAKVSAIYKKNVKVWESLTK